MTHGTDSHGTGPHGTGPKANLPEDNRLPDDNRLPGDNRLPDDNRLIDKALLDVLVCPITRGPLEYDRANGELISRQAGKAFPIRGGVPVMLVDEARALGPVGDAGK